MDRFQSRPPLQSSESPGRWTAYSTDRCTSVPQALRSFQRTGAILTTCQPTTSRARRQHTPHKRTFCPSRLGRLSAQRAGHQTSLFAGFVASLLPLPTGPCPAHCVQGWLCTRGPSLCLTRVSVPSSRCLTYRAWCTATDQTKWHQTAADPGPDSPPTCKGKMQSAIHMQT